MSCGIYKIVNNINNKFYIGKSVNIENRWKQHCYAKDSSPIHVAIQKYGKENFSFYILEECSLEDLNQREIYWINLYSGYEDYNCYNATRGGDGASHPVKISHQQLLEIIDLLKTSNLSFIEIANKFNTSPTTISSINVGKSRRLIDEKYPLRNNNQEQFKIQFTKEQIEKIINTSKSLKEASQKINVSFPTFQKICKYFNIEYTTEAQLYHSIKVYQCNKDTLEIIHEYNSIREAARAMSCNAESIRKALKSKTHISKGFYWKT